MVVYREGRLLRGILGATATNQSGDNQTEQHCTAIRRRQYLVEEEAVYTSFATVACLLLKSGTSASIKRIEILRQRVLMLHVRNWTNR